MAKQIEDKERINSMLFELFPSLERPLLNEISNESKAWHYQTGEMPMQTGRHIHNMLFILDGLVKVFRQDEDGGEFFMYYIKPGQACALSIACTNQNDVSQVRAVVVKPTIALMAPHKFMEVWMRQYVTWGRFIIETFKHRMEDILLTFDYVAFRSLDERLEFYLKRMARERNTLDLNISHQSISEDLNTSREVISRLLKKMEQRGMIRLHRQHVILLDNFVA